MFSLPFLHRARATAHLTEERMYQILNAADCSVSSLFGAVLAVDRSGQHYFLCRQAHLAATTVQQFTEALALSFRVRAAGHVEDPDERDLT